MRARVSLGMALALAFWATVPAHAADVRRADGVEIITGRPAQGVQGAAAMAPGQRSLPRAGAAPVPPEPMRADTPGATAPVEDGVVQQRLRAAEAVLQDQISAYNLALHDDAGPAVLTPLESAISRTLAHIETLVRSARPQEP